MLSYIRAALRPPCSPSANSVDSKSANLTSPDRVDWKGFVFDTIKSIRDPEKVDTLEELDIVREDLVQVVNCGDFHLVVVEFVPTVPHCTLANLIGLCIISKLGRELPAHQFKIELNVAKGSHNSAEEITKQLNDKERVAAALENPTLLQTVHSCIADPI